MRTVEPSTDAATSQLVIRGGEDGQGEGEFGGVSKALPPTIYTDEFCIHGYTYTTYNAQKAVGLDAYKPVIQHFSAKKAGLFP